MSRLLLVLTAFAASLAVASASGNVVCYFTSWTIYRPGNGKFGADNVDPNLCTHILYSFVAVNNNYELVYADDWEANGLGEIQKLMNLKRRNPKLKILASAGGWNAGSGQYSNIAMNPSARQKFARNVAMFVNQHDFDGFDFDWEYPAQHEGSRPQDRHNYVLLLKELKAALRGKLLTAAVAAGPNSVDISYDVPNVAKYLDHINIMAYDFHGAYDGRLGHNAPLYASRTDYNKLLNVEASVKHWISKGARPQQINLGLATYGRSFTMSGNNHNLNAPAAGAGTPGQYTREGGMLGYNEICELYKHWQYVWDNEQQVPHKYNGNQWVGYDDPKSIKLKAQFAKKMKLGGIMFWSMDTDDFRGICQQGAYPLIKSAKSVL